MEIYTLVSLMRCIRLQKRAGYSTFNVLADIFENPALDDVRKRFLIVSGLRASGLYELGYQGDVFEEYDEVWDLSANEYTTFPGVYQIFNCNLRNGHIRIDINLS